MFKQTRAGGVFVLTDCADRIRRGHECLSVNLGHEHKIDSYNSLLVLRLKTQSNFSEKGYSFESIKMSNKSEYTNIRQQCINNPNICFNYGKLNHYIENWCLLPRKPSA